MHRGCQAGKLVRKVGFRMNSGDSQIVAGFSTKRLNMAMDSRLSHSREPIARTMIRPVLSMIKVVGIALMPNAGTVSPLKSNRAVNVRLCRLKKRLTVAADS